MLNNVNVDWFMSTRTVLNNRENNKSEYKIVKHGTNSWCGKHYKRVDQIIKCGANSIKLCKTNTTKT